MTDNPNIAQPEHAAVIAAYSALAKALDADPGFRWTGVFSHHRAKAVELGALR